MKPLRLTTHMPCLLLAVVLAGCATRPLGVLSPADVPAALSEMPTHQLLLLGEQHDADAHQALERATVAHLAQSERLTALVLEMAERGAHTRGVATDATEADVRSRLAWDDAGWPWMRYGPVVMTAVRAGVPVLGGNLPRNEMRAAMTDASLDARLTPEALARQRDNIRNGHCGLLPESQLTPMARIQIARDLSMAQTLTPSAGAHAGGGVVVLVAGAEHVRRSLGVPAHLTAEHAALSQVVVMHSGAPDANARLGVDRLWITPATDPQDHCAELRRRWGKPAAP